MINALKVIITIINLLCIIFMMTATIVTTDVKLSNRSRRILDTGTMILAFNTFAIWWR